MCDRSISQQIHTNVDVYICTSKAESSPLSVWEALSKGIPIVSTDVGDVPLFVQNNINGYILPIRNLEILKSKIKYLYENKNICKHMGNEAKKKVSNKFSWESYGNNVIQTYQNLLTKT